MFSDKLLNDMSKSIFEYEDYRAYLKDWILAQPRRGHGLRSQLATAAGCNTTYISQVLAQTAHLSQEQGERAAHFMRHGEDETLYFLLQIQFARAGTPTLRALIRKQMQRALDQHFNLKKRLEFKSTLSAQDQATYYSAWYYAAIHVVLSIHNLQTKQNLSQYFGLSNKVVAKVLDFLTSTGLAVEENGRYKSGAVSIHLDRESPMILKHHANWRLRGIDVMNELLDDNLFYSSVVSFAKKDQARVRSALVKAIEEVRSIVKASPEDEAYCYSIDFFGLSRQGSV